MSALKSRFRSSQSARAGSFTQEQSASKALPSQSNEASPAKRRNSLVTEIYFSPIEATHSTVELSSPLNSPLIAPTRDTSPSSAGSTVSSGKSLDTTVDSLSVSQLNRLVSALVNAPTVLEHVKPRAKGNEHDEERSENAEASMSKWSASTPSLTKGSSCETSSSSDADSSKVATDNFNSRAPPTARLQELFETMFGDRMDVGKAPQSKIAGMWLVDSTTKITRYSKNYAANGLHGSKLPPVTLPHGLSLNRSVMLFPHASGDEIKTIVILRIVVQVVRRRSGKKTHLLVVDVDVTESFGKAAIFEVLQNLVKSSEPHIMLPTLTTQAIDTTVTTLSKLSKETCTMQTLILLSELDRITGQFQEFYIITAKEMHSTGHPNLLNVRWASYAMSTLLSPEDEQDLQEMIVEIVSVKSVGKDVFASRVEWDGKGKRIHCVPMIEGPEQTTPMTWACFARDGFDIGHW